MIVAHVFYFAGEVAESFDTCWPHILPSEDLDFLVDEMTDSCLLRHPGETEFLYWKGNYAAKEKNASRGLARNTSASRHSDA